MGNIKAVKILLKDQININQKDQDGCNTLTHAPQRSHAEVVQMLLAYHANINLLPRNAVAIGLYEALRQQQFTQLACE